MQFKWDRNESLEKCNHEHGSKTFTVQVMRYNFEGKCSDGYYFIFFIKKTVHMAFSDKSPYFVIHVQ